MVEPCRKKFAHGVKIWRPCLISKRSERPGNFVVKGFCICFFIDLAARFQVKYQSVSPTAGITDHRSLVDAIYDKFITRPKLITCTRVHSDQPSRLRGFRVEALEQ